MDDGTGLIKTIKSLGRAINLPEVGSEFEGKSEPHNPAMTPLISLEELDITFLAPSDVLMTHNKANFGLRGHQLQQRLNKGLTNIFFN